MSWHLYRCFDAEGWLLYIGETGQGIGRFHNQDRVDAEWFPRIKMVTFEEYDTAALAKEAERRAIETEHPIYNAQHAIGSRAWRTERQRERRKGKRGRGAGWSAPRTVSLLRAVDAAKDEGDTARAIRLYMKLDTKIKYALGCLVCNAPARANPMCTRCHAAYRREVVEPRRSAKALRSCL